MALKVRTPNSLKIYMSFGMHGRGLDAKQMVPELDSFKPHVFLSEGADTLVSNRVETIRKLNQLVSKGRSTGFKGFKPKVRYPSGYLDTTYNEEELNLIIARSDLVVAYAEAYSESELALFNAATLSNSAKIPLVLDLVFNSRISDAMDIVATATRGEFESHLSPRNVRISEGLVDLPDVLTDLGFLPDVECPIKIFARFGTLHVGLIDLLVAKGFDVSSKPLNEIGLTSYADVRLSKDPSSKLTKDDLLRYLFLHSCAHIVFTLGIGLEIPNFDKFAIDTYQSIGSYGFLQILTDANRSSQNSFWLDVAQKIGLQ